MSKNGVASRKARSIIGINLIKSFQLFVVQLIPNSMFFTCQFIFLFISRVKFKIAILNGHSHCWNKYQIIVMKLQNYFQSFNTIRPSVPFVKINESLLFCMFYNNNSFVANGIY